MKVYGRFYGVYKSSIPSSYSRKRAGGARRGKHLTTSGSKPMRKSACCRLRNALR